MRIFACSRYLQKLVSVGAILGFIFSFFANQNFSRKDGAATHMDRSSTSNEISLLPSKSKRPSIRKKMGSSLSPQLIVLVFTKQPYAERYLTNIFSLIFLELLESSSSALKYIPKSFRKFTKKNTRGKVLC